MPNWTKEQMDAISKSGSNIIVSAGAGSGKTAVLTERVINKLKQGIKINELLILTFTNAAAKEMQDRIRDEITKYDELKDNLNYLAISYITTFDSYTLSLVKKYNYLLNVSNDLSIIDDSIITLKKYEIIDKVMQELYEDNDYQFLKLIKDFCIKNDNNIKDAIFTFINHIDNEIDRDEFLDNYVGNYLNDSKIDNYIKDYLNILYEIISNIENNIMLIGESDYKDYYEELLKNFSDLIYHKDYDDIYKDLDNITIPKRPKGSDEIKDLKDNIDKLLKDLKSYMRFKDNDEIKESFMIIKEYINVLIKIFKRYYKLMDEYKFNNDLYEFSDIAKMAIKLLKDNPEIRLELKNFYHEIMIDEYQDTNNIQEEFVKLIENNNVYMVGDIKQSIYGFRNANPIIFKEKYDKYSLNDGGIKIDLLKNFRSRSEVLDGINLIFSYIMDDYLGGCDYRNYHQMNYGNKMYDLKNKNDDYKLEILNYDNSNDKLFNNEEIESFIIGKDILNKINNNYEVIDKKSKTLRKAEFSDFCIIMDRGSSFKTYKKVFEYLGIPLNLYMDRTLTNEVDILVLNNFISLLIKISNNEYDDEFKYNFVSVARSFLFSYSDNKIFNILNKKNYFETDIYKICIDLLKEIDTLNVYEILELVITKLDYYDKIVTISNVEDTLLRLDNLLTIARNLSNLGYSLEDLKDYLKEIINSNNEIKYSVNDLNNNAVKIMNIHKSKGLEFPICYFSGLYKTFNKEDIKDKFVYSNTYKIIIPYYKEGIGDTILKDLFKREYVLNDISERIRLFYVALTRAKEKIIIVAPLKEGNIESNIVDNNIREKYNSFLSFLISIQNKLINYIKDVNLNDYNLTKDYLFKNITKENNDNNIKDVIEYKNIHIINNIIKKEQASKKVLELVNLDDVKKMEYGSFIHQIFEEVDFLEVNDKNPYYKEIMNLVNSLNINKDSIIYKEHEFLFEKDDTLYQGCIDLIVINDKELKLVDYKLKDISLEAYEKQLNIYYDYLKEFFKDKDIKLYLYSILNNELKLVNKKEK